MGIILLHDHAPAVVRLLRAMGHENRLLILCELMAREQSVKELAGTLGMRQASLSQHLAKLRYAGLVRASRRSRSIFYSVPDLVLGQAIEALIATAARSSPPLRSDTGRRRKLAIFQGELTCQLTASSSSSQAASSWPASRLRNSTARTGSG